MPSAHLSQPHFRRVCARFATGVTIVTVADSKGAPHGITVNSFTSVSLAPPMILICLDHRARILKHFHHGAHFGVNVLHEQQRDLSVRFARAAEDHFEGVEWRPGHNGTPVMSGVLASLECHVSRIVEGGDHSIVIAEVLQAAAHDGPPLIYFNSGYQALR